jgi:hypothetical protein
MAVELFSECDQIRDTCADIKIDKCIIFNLNINFTNSNKRRINLNTKLVPVSVDWPPI